MSITGGQQLLRLLIAARSKREWGIELHDDPLDSHHDSSERHLVTIPEPGGLTPEEAFPQSVACHLLRHWRNQRAGLSDLS